MHTADANKNTTADAQQTRNRPVPWIMLVVGLAVGSSGMHLLVVRPLKQHVEALQRQVVFLRRDIQQLIGAHDQMVATNEHVADLTVQQRELDNARRAWQQIQQFRARVVSESQRSAEALTVLDDLLAVQDTLIRQRDRVHSACEALNTLASLKQQWVGLHDTAEQADRAMDRIAAVKRRAVIEAYDADLAQASLQHLASLKRRLIDEVDDLDQAGRNLNQMMILKNTVMEESDDLETARALTEELLTLKDEIVLRGANTTAARGNARRLMALRDDFDSAPEALERARRNLNQMVILKNTVMEESDDLETARNLTEELLTLKDQIVLRGTNVATAEGNARRLMALRNQLSGDDIDVETADRTLRKLLELQASLARRPHQVRAAPELQTMLSDYSRRIEDEVANLPEGRRRLIKALLLQRPLVGALQVVAPFLELGDRGVQESPERFHATADGGRTDHLSPRLSRRAEPPGTSFGVPPTPSLGKPRSVPWPLLDDE